ncbi:GntP family permease [Pseudomonas synxantha]|uniref:GntP family permease n=1 Tax=Pseudomonas synxantha TaxID=47883 RepID=A0ABS0UQH1_9PSED|nr:GntP family permease [Pseudomonas synxantha]MBI6567534.1 GntP family permease [Pseudomonas synxantha]MBI6582351.1 GntP family permease [Pseudomonas synxantha]MBI6645406.1 GntP family permease [Pseudomonas synxantha]
MDVLVILAALSFLIFMAYRGYSVIIFAPIAALGAILLTEPSAVAPAYFSVFLEKMAAFIKSFLPVFLLGALFGKMIELSGNSRSISSALIRLVGGRRAVLVIVLMCAILTYGGVSLNVVVFAVYPFAVELYKQGNIPKRLIPGAVALGAFTFTMDSLPGSPQIQNIIPTTFFQTDTWAAPWLGTIGGIMIFSAGMVYLEWRRRAAARAGEGYGSHHINEPGPIDANERLPHPLLALLPLIVVCVCNFLFLRWIPQWYGSQYHLQIGGMTAPSTIDVKTYTAVWAVLGALIMGIFTVIITRGSLVLPKFAEGSKTAISGSLLASMNSASEYGFGAVMAILPGFVIAAKALQSIPDPLFNEAISITVLSALTGSAIAGLSIALGAMADTFVAAAHASGIPLEVFHRIASMASGGMDTLPHNGAVITLLTVCGLTHRESYADIFAITLIKTAVAALAILLFYSTGIV